VRYRVAFAKKFESGGQEGSIEPSLGLDSLLPEGVIAEKQFVARLEPQAQHSDDAFLGSAAPEIWEYEVVDERAVEFEEIMHRSGRVFEYDVVDPTSIDSSEVVGELLNSPYDDVASPREEPKDVNEEGSGERAGDHGPAGQPKADPSVGGLNVGSERIRFDTEEDLRTGGSNELEDLTVMKAHDPRLGLTNRGKKTAEDWAADTGESRNPDRGIETGRLRDYGSTLGPDRKKR
jgi:hypothetical protein